VSGGQRPSFLRLLPGLALAVAILFLLARKVDPATVWKVLRGASLPLLLLAFAGQLASIWLKGERWAVAIAAGAGPPPRRRLLTASVVGTAANLLLPARLGDVVRVLVLRKHNEVPASLGLMSSWSVQLFDMLAVAVILVVAGVFGPAVAPLPVLLAVLAGVLGLLVVLYLVHRFPDAAERIERRIVPRFAQARVLGVLAGLRRGLRFLGSGRTLLRVLGWTAAVWLFEAAAMTLGLRAFGLSLGPPAAALLVAAIGLSFALPLTPGNVGTYQLIAVLVLGAFGIDRDRAFAFALGYQAVSILWLVAAALVLLQREGLDWRTLPTAAATTAAGDTTLTANGVDGRRD
jgi:glycosyltransferase 2 family protein